MFLKPEPRGSYETNNSSKIEFSGVAMDYQEYIRLTSQISQLMASSKFKEAIDALYPLILSDIADIDKVVLCIDLATAYDRLGNTDDALSWYDKGIAIEEVYCRYSASEKKAQYLSQLGRNKEAMIIHEALIKENFVSECDKERMRKTIRVLLGKSTREWQ
jgi:tetratricopeptide (TPR) repeat protein